MAEPRLAHDLERADVGVDVVDSNGQGSSCELRVSGMDCASCAASIERALGGLDGVVDVRVDVLGGRVRVGLTEEALASGAVARNELAGAIRGVGFRVDDVDVSGRPGDSTTDAVVPPTFWEMRGRTVTTAFSGVTLAIGLVVGWVAGPPAVVTLLLALSSIAGGWFVFPRGLRAARQLALDMNFLITVAATGAWLIGQPAEAAATLFLFAVAELLESHSMDRARNAIRALISLSPSEATVVRDGVESRIPVDEIAVGEMVVVRPGEKIAVDGEVVEGRSSVNQAPITGESMPVDREQGDELFAGTLNGHGALLVRATRLASDTTLARIVHAVEEAQGSRAPTQTFVDRFARVYTPTVVALAILIAVLPPLLALGAWDTWIYRALAMLVIACPCALVISTPVSIVSGLAAAARGGVLIKGGAYLEAAGEITTVAFDKTGTLTLGEPAVTDVIILGTTPESELLRLALGVERQSEHPLARAVMDHGRELGITAPPSTDFQALVGRGASAQVDGPDGAALIHVGNQRLARELGLDDEATSAVFQRLMADGKSVLFVAREQEMLGIIAIADQTRPGAAEMFADLRASGVRRVVMVTGDNAGSARAVATALGIDEFHAELLPDDKVRVVRELLANGDRVAFVGDGVNDAPALATATVGVAMGAAGTDVALETADIALMGDDLSRLAFAIRLSQRTRGIIRQNIWFAVAVKAVFLVLAASGWATLWMAVAADMGSSLAVIGNGLRALRVPGARRGGASR